MTAAYLNSLGLAFDIVGVILLFKFGLPEEVRRGGTGFLIVNNDDQEAAKAKIYDRYSHVALALIVLGFGLQIVSNHCA